MVNSASASSESSVVLLRYVVKHLFEQPVGRLIFAAPDEQFDELRDQFEHVRSSIELGYDFERYKAQVQGYLEQHQMINQQITANAMANMAAEQAASWDRRSAIIRETNDYTTNVMHEMQASTAATHDRVANLHSEMLRETNVYYGTDGRLVEADIGYDHVYQYQPDQDWLLGVEGDWLTPGVDFTELGRADGRY